MQMLEHQTSFVETGAIGNILQPVQTRTACTEFWSSWSVRSQMQNSEDLNS